ncbi:MAG: GGDEF domain-containing protein [Magnetococcales bacterium]|nr:GGDEF domain-containing protein [Magnetococcales bacterium]
MGTTLSHTSRHAARINPSQFAKQAHELIEEIEEYIQENERNGQIYAMHRLLGSTVDLDAMIGAFSRWLSQITTHYLVAFRFLGGRRICSACSHDSCRVPPRLQLNAIFNKLISHSSAERQVGSFRQSDLYYHFWQLDRQDKDCLLIVHPKPELLVPPFQNFEEEILKELMGPLNRALAYERLYDLARRDALTGLANRRVFEERAITEMATANRQGHPLVLACMDLDHFKVINDRLGHGRGDEVLQTVSQTFSRMVRDSDLLARVGGDEFIMILPNTTLENAGQLMERLCASIRGLDIRVPGFPALGVSVGLALWRPNDSLESWSHQADEALYRAKSAGRSRVCC